MNYYFFAMHFYYASVKKCVSTNIPSKNISSLFFLSSEKKVADANKEGSRKDWNRCHKNFFLSLLFFCSLSLSLSLSLFLSLFFSPSLFPMKREGEKNHLCALSPSVVFCSVQKIKLSSLSFLPTSLSHLSFN